MNLNFIKKYRFLLIGIVLIVFYISMKAYWGTNTIGSFFSKENYRTKYYVQMFPEGSNDSQNFIVPAELIVSGNNIIIENVQWSNGSYTTFDDYGDMDQDAFYHEKEITIPDDEGRYWTIILTDKKVK